jgi:cytochrome c oxidase subunit IV
MSERDSSSERAQSSSSERARLWHLWFDAGLVWLGLLALFAINVVLAYLRFGGANIAIHMSIAMIMIVLLVLFFMDFRAYSTLLRLTGFAGLFWLIFMFALTASDYLTRQ